MCLYRSTSFYLQSYKCWFYSICDRTKSQKYKKCTVSDDTGMGVPIYNVLKGRDLDMKTNKDIGH